MYEGKHCLMKLVWFENMPESGGGLGDVVLL